jgi:hypothetical protein
MPVLQMSTATDVRLQLDLESPDGYAHYRALVRTAGGTEVWREDALKPAPTSSGQSLALTIPGARLADDDYTIRVSGVTGSGEVDELSGYAFRVRIR